ncbi:MAG: DpnD/PcfM family protein [Oscillospiraceae bacterium]|nr:DpnD/PcfM family protein [Oscillospiraceae bacterium]
MKPYTKLKRYIVKITRMFHVSVDAESPHDARDIVAQGWRDGINEMDATRNEQVNFLVTQDKSCGIFDTDEC